MAQHAKCIDCAKLQKLRRDSKTKSERDGYQEHLEKHLRAMLMDRAVDARYGQPSQESVEGTLTEGAVLSIAMDGMDQAKFNCPSNVENATALEGLWRPVLHMRSAMVESLGEYFFVSEADTKNNSDMHIQILGRLLDKVRSTLQARLLVLPQHLVVLTDNTAREQTIIA